METKDIIMILIGIINLIFVGLTCFFIFRSISIPIDAVKLGRQLNDEQNKYAAKRNLFLLLFSLRGSPLHYDFVRGLNQIEVVFEDVPPVLSAWREHFRSLQLKNQVDANKNWEIERAALLSAMALHLDYSSIPHGELLRDYYPEGHENDLKAQMSFRDIQVDYFLYQGQLAKIAVDRMKDQDAGVRDENGQLKIT